MPTNKEVMETLHLLQQSINLTAAGLANLRERIATIEWRQEWEVQQWRRAYVKAPEQYQTTNMEPDPASGAYMPPSQGFVIDLSSIKREEEDGAAVSSTSGEQLSDDVEGGGDRGDA